MEYAKPGFNVQRVNAAGKIIIKFLETSGEEWNAAFDVIENWRAAHHFPLNSFYTTLKNRARSVHIKSLNAQRIKRFVSIAFKLLNRPDMKLSQMQDIGGCRAVLPNVADVQKLRGIYLNKPLAHVFTGEKDYIANPQSTGYRSIHLKYRFRGNGSSAPWDGLKIEIQLRTQVQHRWATAVEAAGTFTKAALKSNKGKKEWLRFFALMSSVYALREGTPAVPGTPSTLDELYAEIQQLDRTYHIVAAFSQYRVLIPHFERKSQARYYLVTLDPIQETVNVVGFKADQSQEANKAYTEEEKKLGQDATTQVVLVSVSSVRELRRAYPNYFLDTEDFLRDILKIVRNPRITE
jgi:ppGpp synthetase/RelA/SpoT-type nucleotidyltranferase